MSDVLVQYLREARATEAGLTRTLQAHIAATPPSEHRQRLERHLETTREHERMLAARCASSIVTTRCARRSTWCMRQSATASASRVAQPG